MAPRLSRLRNRARSRGECSIALISHASDPAIPACGTGVGHIKFVDHSPNCPWFLEVSLSMTTVDQACSKTQIGDFIFHLPYFWAAADNWLRIDVRGQSVTHRVLLDEPENKGYSLAWGSCKLFAGNSWGISAGGCVGSLCIVCLQLNLLQVCESYALFPPQGFPTCMFWGTVLSPPQPPYPEYPLLFDMSHSPF